MLSAVDTLKGRFDLDYHSNFHQLCYLLDCLKVNLDI